MKRIQEGENHKKAKSEAEKRETEVSSLKKENSRNVVKVDHILCLLVFVIDGGVLDIAGRS